MVPILAQERMGRHNPSLSGSADPDFWACLSVACLGADLDRGCVMAACLTELGYAVEVLGLQGVWCLGWSCQR